MTDEEEAARKAKRRARIRMFVTWGISIVAIVLIVRIVPFRDRCTDAGCEKGVFSTLAGANPAFLALAASLYAISIVFWALRWRALLSIAGVRPPVLTVLRISIEAQAAGVLLPAAIAGDALRVAYVREQSPGSELGKIIASIFVDRIIGLVTLSSLALTGAIVFRMHEAGPFLPLLAAFPVGGAVAFVVLRIPALRRWKLLENRFVAKIATPMLEYAASEKGPRALAESIFLSLLVSSAQLAVIRVLIAALAGTPSNEAWVVVGTTMSFIVAALPAAPGGLGTLDAAYVYFLGRAGVAAGVAIAVCLTFRVLFYALATIGALLNVSRRKSAG